MRRVLATLSSGLVLVLAAGVVASGAQGASAPGGGGAAGPQPGDSADPSTSGGTAYERRRRRRARRRRVGAPLLASFGLRRPRLFLYGRPAQVAFRIRSRVKLVDVRISVIARGARTPASTLRLGARRAGVAHTVPLTGRESGTLSEGAYRVRVSAKDARGRRLRRGAGVSSAGDLSSSTIASRLGDPSPTVAPTPVSAPTARVTSTVVRIWPRARGRPSWRRAAGS